ncbi:MAG TPA: hypothetical protein VIM11_06345 [Tepidisphaeraceae bacterium]
MMGYQSTTWGKSTPDELAAFPATQLAAKRLGKPLQLHQNKLLMCPRPIAYGAIAHGFWECEAPAELKLCRKTRLGRSLALPVKSRAIAL